MLKSHYYDDTDDTMHNNDMHSQTTNIGLFCVYGYEEQDHWKPHKYLSTYLNKYHT